MSNGDAIARRPESGMAVMPAEMTIEELVARTRKVQEAMKAVMKDGEHYGVIPGTPKPTLLKPGAEKLLNLFMLDPEYAAVREPEDGAHLTITSTCTLYHIGTGARLGSGMGSCSTRESKYAYRNAKRVCPKCGAEAINKSKFPPRGKRDEAPGWYCYAKVGGCGVEFSAEDPAITGQVLGRVDNPDKADQYNTVLKMANKRSLVAAVLNVTAASDIFTQDLEDMPGAGDTHTQAAGAATSVPGTAAASVAGAPAPGMASEEMFDAPAEREERDARGALLELVKGVADHLKLKAADRARLWTAHCGRATPDTVDVAALQGLYDALKAQAEAAAG